MKCSNCKHKETCKKRKDNEGLPVVVVGCKEWEAE
jgi:hypothetical protein